MGDTPGQPLFPSLYARGAGSHAGLSNEFGRLMERAGIGIPPGRQKAGKGRQFRALGFHSLRHSFISRLANAEVGPDVRRELAGHSNSSDEIHRKYMHLDLSLQRKAINQLSSITH
jgi:integrase